ncbi:MAG: hypothetical protein HYZ65_03365 [Burkholderiales bacterium]|nr:hypothetical protein [Burkholderiales bacterium]
MKKALFAATCCSLLLMTAQAQDVGVSIQFGQPGFYGRLDIGNYPQPQLVYIEPRIVERVAVLGPPLYLVVPPGHIKHWEKHCYRYNACNRQVYFVQENWYNSVVVPRYREGQYRDNDQGNHGRGNEHGKGHGKGHGHGNHDD